MTDPVSATAGNAVDTVGSSTEGEPPAPVGLAGPRRTRRRKRRGFALLMALMLVVLAAAILVRLARESLQVSAVAAMARRELQRRWGSRFLARALLADPESPFGRLGAETAGRRHFPIRTALQLGGERFEIVLDDENRKLNVNRLYGAVGRSAWRRTVERLSGGGVPIADPASSPFPFDARRFASWGQVVRIRPAEAAAAPGLWWARVSKCMTCWGDGKVNVHRCSDAVLREAAGIAVDPATAARLVELRRQVPRLALTELLRRVVRSPRDTAMLQGWLCDRSSCYSLLVVSGDNVRVVDCYIATKAGSRWAALERFQW